MRPLAATAALGLAIALAGSGAARGQGGPPLRTDDPGTPGAGRFEINVCAAFEKDGGTRVADAPLLDLNYGLGERMQLKYEVPWVFVDEPGAGVRDGLGSSLAGFKWRFRDARGRSPAMAVYPQVGFENPGSSSGERGIAEEGTSLLLPVQAAWDLGELGVCVELGRELRNAGDDGWMAGIAFSRAISDRTVLLAEVFTESSPRIEDSDAVWNVGSRVAMGPSCSLLASAGSGLWSSGDDRVDLQAYFGVQFLR